MEYTILIAVIFGGMLGEVARRASKQMITNRTMQPSKSSLLNNKLAPLLWIVISALGCVGIVLLTYDVVSKFEYMCIYIILISISAIDNEIRKIPNMLILLLIAVKTCATLIVWNPEALLPAFAGLVAGIVLFLLPSKLGISIGWGDVKLAAAAGFCLGIIGVLQAILIMSAVLALYLCYLVITKKGSFKTKVAIGPSLSVGVMVTLLFPLALLPL